MFQYGKTVLLDLKEGVRIKAVLVKAVLYDLLFYILLFVGFYIWGSFLKKKAVSLQYVDYGSIMGADAAALQTTLSILQGFLVFLILSIIAFLLYVIIIFAIFKGKIWFSYSKEKYNFRVMMKFFLLSLIYLAPAFIILVWFILRLKQEGIYIYLALILIFVHFNVLMNLYFAHNPSIRKSLGFAFKTGIFKVYKFITHYLIIGAVFVIVQKTLSSVNFIKGGFNVILYFIILLIAIAFARNYFFAIAKKEMKNE